MSLSPLKEYAKMRENSAPNLPTAYYEKQITKHYSASLTFTKAKSALIKLSRNYSRKKYPTC